MHDSARHKERHHSDNGECGHSEQHEIEEVKHEFEEHKITFLDAGARIELAASEHESDMLPLHHPAKSDHSF